MIAAIVAADYNNAIGYNNDLLFRIPSDLKRFRELTTGQTVIMGRKTYDSLPNKPLPNRVNYVITSKVQGLEYGTEKDVFFSNMETIKEILRDDKLYNNPTNNIFIIGGGTVYKELLPYCQRVYLTRVHMMYKNVDTFFPRLDDKEWNLSSKSDSEFHNGMAYEYQVYDRIHNIYNMKINIPKKEKKIFIINGSGGVGKDSFVDIIGKMIPTINFSSVDKVKEIAKMAGWHGGKSEKDRKFLSDLKTLCSEYNDMPLSSMKEKAFEFERSDSIALFLHIREPNEIEIAKKIFNAETVLVKRDSVKHITSNMADENVYNYQYDYVINNNGTLDDLEKEAEMFAKKAWGLNY